MLSCEARRNSAGSWKLKAVRIHSLTSSMTSFVERFGKLKHDRLDKILSAPGFLVGVIGSEGFEQTRS